MNRKLLIDACVFPTMVPLLTGEGYDVVHVRELPGNPADREILDLAVMDGRIVITFDKGFTDYLQHGGKRHVGIIRLQQLPIHLLKELVPNILVEHAALLANSGVVIVEAGGIRLLEAVDESNLLYEYFNPFSQD